MAIRILQEDILQSSLHGVDLIVNPANQFLSHGGGLAGKIDHAAKDDDGSAVGFELSDRWIAQQRGRRVATGGAVVTTAGNLPFLAVIHAVGPIWAGGHLYEYELLQAAHASALSKANLMGELYDEDVHIAFPAISCGIFKFPVVRAAEAVAGLIKTTCAAAVGEPYVGDMFPRVKDISFYLFEDAHLEAYKTSFRELQIKYEVSPITSEHGKV